MSFIHDDRKEQLCNGEGWYHVPGVLGRAHCHGCIMCRGKKIVSSRNEESKSSTPAIPNFKHGK